MKKNLLCFICLTSVCLLSACAGDNNQKTADSSDLASVIQEVHSLPDAEINIPAALVGDEISEENAVLITEAENKLENKSEENTSSPSSEADNSNTLTYSITGEERTNIVNGLSQDVIDGIDNILSNKDQYPNIVSITPNEDCTEFTIAVTDGQVNIYESMLVMSFYTIGDKYQIYNGVPSEDVKTVVKYVNASTGELIIESDSTQMNTN